MVTASDSTTTREVVSPTTRQSLREAEIAGRRTGELAALGGLVFVAGAAVSLGIGAPQALVAAAAIVSAALALRLRPATTLAASLVAFNLFKPAADLVALPRQHSDALEQIDEFVAVGLLIGAMSVVALSQLRRAAVLGAVMVVAVGIVSALLHDRPLPATLRGAWLGGRFWVFLVVSVIVVTSANRRNIMTAMAYALGALVVAGGIFALADMVSQVADDLFRRENVNLSRAGFRSTASFFAHPGHSAAIGAYGLALWLPRFATRRSFHSIVIVAAAAMLLLTSLRLKGLLSIGAIVVVVLVVGSQSQRRTVLLWLPLGIVLALLLGGAALRSAASTQTHEFSDLDNLRGELYVAAWSIAADRVPIGSGYGTFGSRPSLDTPSPLYVEYGLPDPARPSVLSQVAFDAAWATLLAESGWLGVGTIGLILAHASLVSRRRLDASSTISIIAVATVEASGNPTFFATEYAPLIALIVAAAWVGPREADHHRPGPGTHAQRRS